MSASLGAGRDDQEDSVAGAAQVVIAPAQAGSSTPSVSPKPTKNESANNEAINTLPTNDIVASDLPADTENAAEAAGVVIALAARADEAAEAVARPADGLVTVRPKPEKRKNAKERAKEKITRDGTTPMTAKAKSNGVDKAKDKAAERAEKAKVKEQKADTKAHKISAAKAAKAARAA